MYELRKGTMVLKTFSKTDMENYQRAGWKLIKTKIKEKPTPTENKRKQIKKEIDFIVDEVLNEELTKKNAKRRK